MKRNPIEKIIMSKRGCLYFIEHARLEVFGGTLEVLSEDKNNERFTSYNIPYANTSLVLLGEGTSITRNAARLLADYGVLLGFTGGGGTPLLSATSESSVALIEPSSEYRPTEYMTAWAKIFFNEEKRLKVAKRLLIERIDKTNRLWAELPETRKHKLVIDKNEFVSHYNNAATNQDLLLAEARYTKIVYKTVSEAFKIDFTRDFEENLANNFLSHANYLAYGVAGVVLHTLGISYAFPVLHGKTRRGGLVFDIADLIKDGLTVPIALSLSVQQVEHKDLRKRLVEAIHETKIIPYLFDTIKKLIEEAQDND